MKKHDAVAALAALSQDNRLDVFRLLVEAGRDGLPAGSVAEALKLAPNTLTFHFDRLRDAGTGHSAPRRPFDDLLRTVRDDERAQNCCRGRADKGTPVKNETSRPRRKELLT